MPALLFFAPHAKLFTSHAGTGRADGGALAPEPDAQHDRRQDDGRRDPRKHHEDPLTPALSVMSPPARPANDPTPKPVSDVSPYTRPCRRSAA